MGALGKEMIVYGEERGECRKRRWVGKEAYAEGRKKDAALEQLKDRES